MDGSSLGELAQDTTSEAGSERGDLTDLSDDGLERVPVVLTDGNDNDPPVPRRAAPSAIECDLALAEAQVHRPFACLGGSRCELRACTLRARHDIQLGVCHRNVGSQR